MEAIVVKVRNKDEFDLVNKLFKQMKIRSTVVKKKPVEKKKEKEAFRNSLPNRLNEVKLHMQGKVKLYMGWTEERAMNTTYNIIPTTDFLTDLEKLLKQHKSIIKNIDATVEELNQIQLQILYLEKIALQ